MSILSAETIQKLEDEKFAKDQLIELLCCSCRLGDKPKALALIESGISVNSKDSQGISPLHWAAAFNCPDTVQYLLTAKANIHQRNNAGYTPLHNACLSGNLKLAVLLIQEGADLYEHNNHGKSPLDLYGTAYGSEISESDKERHKALLKDALRKIRD